jgi:26S proteasome regulatory subunit T5
VNARQVCLSFPDTIPTDLFKPSQMMKQEQLRLMHEQNTMMEQVADNTQKIKQNKVLPYLVGNVVEILDMDEEEEDGAVKNEQNAKKGKCAVIKTSSRQTVFLPMIGLVPAEELRPGDLIGVNKDSFLVLDTLPAGEPSILFANDEHD